MVFPIISLFKHAEMQEHHEVAALDARGEPPDRGGLRNRILEQLQAAGLEAADVGERKRLGVSRYRKRGKDERGQRQCAETCPHGLLRG